MKFVLPIAALAGLAAAQAKTVEISDLYVDKTEDPISLEISVKSVTFTLNGYNADGIVCTASPPPTWPSDILKCNDDTTNYRFVLSQGTEGSGVTFSVGLYYDDNTAKEHLSGDVDVPTYCTLNRASEDDFRYDCEQIACAGATVTLCDQIGGC